MRTLRRLLHPAYRSLETRLHDLRYLFLEITQRCNLNCLHCGTDCVREARLNELSTEEWIAFADDLPQHFDRAKLALVVTGGEPLCARRLPDILAALKRNGLHWGMVTNGWALTPARLHMLVDNDIMSMTISLDGTKDSHDWLRGREGSFERAREGIRLAAAAGLTNFDVVTCVNPRNLSELPEVMRELRSLGVRAWRLFSIFPKGRAKCNSELSLSHDQLRSLFGWIKDTREQLEGSGFGLEFSCEGCLPKAWDEAVRDEPYFCRAGINVGSVLCDGAIGACPSISRELVQGNIRSDDFASVWDNRFEQYRDRRWMRTGSCLDCAQWRRCQGNSMHLWDVDIGRTAICHHKVLGVASIRSAGSPVKAPEKSREVPSS